MAESTDLQLNIIVIGESGVGKSTLCKRFSGENKSVNGPTIVASSWKKTIVVNDVKVKLFICDAAGQNAFRNNLTSYFQKKDGVLAVYDVTKEDSFQKLSLWLDLVKQQNDDFIALLVGNKIDYSNEKSIKCIDVKKFGEENGLSFMETSAKDGTNVDKVFEYLVLKLLLKKKILSDDNLNFVSSTVLLYESPVLRSSCTVSAQKWVEDVSVTSTDYVLEEDPTQVQNIPIVANSQKTVISAEITPCPPSPSNNGTESDSFSQITERMNRNGTACVNGAAFLGSGSSNMCNELPPVVPLSKEEFIELYVQRQRKMSSESISSLANWDSSIVSEYEEVIRRYEAAREEAARYEKKSNCTLL